MKYIKEHWKFLLFIIVFGIVGGIFTAMFTVSSMTPEMMEEVVKKTGSKEVLFAVSVIQSILYAAICGFIGIILSNKTGLWKDIALEGRKILITAIISVVGGVIFVFADLFLFGKFNQFILESYSSKPSVSFIIASFTYGAVVEEVMLRLFWMTLISFIIWKLFCRHEETVPTAVFVIANVISALLFAAGHLPATVQTFGGLDALLVTRCFVMNGMYGIAFGWLYRKYGIQYSMLAHFGVHFVSKLIWLLFI